MIRRHKKLSAALLAAIVLYLAGALLCLRLFSSLNPVRSLASLARITWGGAPYAQVAAWPSTVYIAPAEGPLFEALEAFMAEQGYTFTERLGAVVLFEKDGTTAIVTVRAGRYYIKWMFDAAP